MTAAAGAPTRWLSRKSLLLHLAVVLAVPLCLFAGWWQATRAMSGNTLSYVYAIEWPMFAVLAVWCWWQLLHPPPEDAPPGDGSAPAKAAERSRRKRVVTPRPLQWEEEEETAELRAYNAYLGDLHAGRRVRGRGRSGRKLRTTDGGRG